MQYNLLQKDNIYILKKWGKRISTDISIPIMGTSIQTSVISGKMQILENQQKHKPFFNSFKKSLQYNWQNDDGSSSWKSTDITAMGINGESLHY